MHDKHHYVLVPLLHSTFLWQRSRNSHLFPQAKFTTPRITFLCMYPLLRSDTWYSRPAFLWQRKGNRHIFSPPQGLTPLKLISNISLTIKEGDRHTFPHLLLKQRRQVQPPVYHPMNHVHPHIPPRPTGVALFLLTSTISLTEIREPPYISTTYC